MPELSIVVPTYNSAGYLAQTVAQLCAALQSENADFEILIVVDGGGTDDPLPLRDGLDRQFPGRLKWVRLDRNEGQQVTTQLGVSLASGNFVVTYDDDLQYQVSDIFRLYSSISRDDRFDVVTGYYPEKPERGGYAVLSRLFVGWLNGVVFRPYRHSKYFSSFKIFRRSMFDRKGGSFNIYHFWEFDPERLSFITIQKQKRLLGKTSYSAFKRLKFVFPILCKCVNRMLPAGLLLAVPLTWQYPAAGGIFVSAGASLYLANAAVLYRHKYRFRNVTCQIFPAG